MPERRSWLARSCSIFMVVALLVMTAATLLHWHTESCDQGCQLCHLHDLSTLHGTGYVIRAIPSVFSPYENSISFGDESEPCIGGTSTRGPPALLFTL